MIGDRLATFGFDVEYIVADGEAEVERGVAACRHPAVAGGGQRGPAWEVLRESASHIWIGGGTLGTILVIVLIVYLIRRA